MALELDLLARKDRLLAVPVVLERDVVHNDRAVEAHGHLLAHHLDVEAVPVAHLPVGDAERLVGVLLVVVEAARADAPVVVGVPDLHLRRAAEVEAAVALHGHDAPVDPHLEVLVVLLRGERVAALEPVEEEVAVADGPVGVAAFVGEVLGLKPIMLDPDVVDDIHNTGGTILGSSRGEQPVEEMVKTLDRLNINILFNIRHNITAGKGCLTLTLSIKWGNTYQSVDTFFGF